MLVISKQSGAAVAPPHDTMKHHQGDAVPVLVNTAELVKTIEIDIETNGIDTTPTVCLIESAPTCIATHELPDLDQQLMRKIATTAITDVIQPAIAVNRTALPLELQGEVGRRVQRLRSHIRKPKPHNHLHQNEVLTKTLLPKAGRMTSNL